MNQYSNDKTVGPVSSLREGRAALARVVGVAALLSAGALACSEATPPTSTPMGGSAGQVTGGSAGSGVTGGSAGTSTGGMPPAAGTGGGGSSSGGAGGTSGGAGGSSPGGSGGGGAGGGGGSGGDEGWVPLFNGTDLTGWTPSAGHTALFAVTELEGENVIHVYPTQADGSNQPEAALRTSDSFSKYVLHVQYKWGINRFGARANEPRDNGICFHICGSNPAKVWPESIELQIGAATTFPHDWITGNIFMLINTTRAQWPYTNQNGAEVWSATGEKKSIGAPQSYYRALVPAQHNMDEGWNTIELTVNAAEKAEYKVNGTVVNEVFDMECQENGTWAPLTEGPIALQAEYAEIYFRDVRIKMMP